MHKALILFLIFYSFSAISQEYERAVFMTVDIAQKKWGLKTFDTQNFKNAGFLDKAAMAVDLVKEQKFTGLTNVEVKTKLGNPTGYFFNDTIPAYIIEPYTTTNKESWQLVFLLKGNKVAETKIQKKCCYTDKIKE